MESDVAFPSLGEPTFRRVALMAANRHDFLKPGSSRSKIMSSHLPFNAPLRLRSRETLLRRFPTFFIASVAESILLAIIMANCLLVFQSISLLELLTRLSNIQHFLKLEIPSNMWYSLVFVRVYRLFKLHFSDNLIRLLFKSYHSWKCYRKVC